jgi:hypothetical protein
LIDLLLTDFFDLLLFANSVMVALHIILRGASIVSVFGITANYAWLATFPIYSALPHNTRRKSNGNNVGITKLHTENAFLEMDAVRALA